MGKLPKKKTEYYQNKRRPLKLKIKKLIKRSIEKGHEHLTVMIIPHSEKKIFNFRISNFILIFFFALVTFLTIGGSYFFVDRGTKQQEIISLTDESLKRSSDIRGFIELVSNLKEKTHNISTSIETLQEITGGESNLIKLMSQKGLGGPEKKESSIYNNFEGDNFKNEKDPTMKEIDDFITLNKQLGVAEEKIASITSLLKGFKSVLKDMPSIFPVLGSRIGRGIITSGFGWRRDPFTHKMAEHMGIDIQNITGTPVISTGNGQVTRATYQGAAGLFVEISHKLGFSTRYMHLSKIIVEKGDDIRKGQVIGLLGNTGRSTGPHLHYEVRINNVSIDPYHFISLDKFENLTNIKK